MDAPTWRALILFVFCTACAAAVVVDRGCAAYGEARTDMPALGDDPVSAWVAKLDSAMTRVCR